jgi:hypothetical protein
MEETHKKQNANISSYPEFEHSTPLLPVLSLQQRAAQPKTKADKNDRSSGEI